MPDPRLLAIITALSLFSTPGSGLAQESLAKLQQLEKLIVSKDCGGMRTFIGANPELTRGNDALAIELRSYANKLDNGLINCFAATSTDIDFARDGESASKNTSEAIY